MQFFLWKFTGRRLYCSKTTTCYIYIYNSSHSHTHRKMWGRQLPLHLCVVCLHTPYIPKHIHIYQLYSIKSGQNQGSSFIRQASGSGCWICSSIWLISITDQQRKSSLLHLCASNRRRPILCRKNWASFIIHYCVADNVSSYVFDLLTCM